MKKPLNFNNFRSQRDVIEYKSPFTKDELDPLVKWVKENRPMKYDSGNYYDEDIPLGDRLPLDELGRLSYTIPFLEDISISNIFVERLSEIVQNANMNYGFDLDNFQELTYFEYSPNSEGKGLPWHMDIGSDHVSYRKLSFTLNLSDKDEYTGGQMEVFIDHNSIYKLPKTYGTLAFFPSFMVHRVSPILSGTRKVIVGMLGGKPYR